MSSRIRAKIDQALENAVRSGVTKIAEDAKRNSSWSADIPDAISVGDVKREGQGVWSGEVIVDLKKAPQAAAFEYGSGVHGEKGETYKIEPDKKDFLSFGWDKVSSSTPRGVKFRGVSKKTGKAIFTFVDHPGVAAKPYLKPAIEKNRKSIRTLILNGFIKGYKDAIDVKVIIK